MNRHEHLLAGTLIREACTKYRDRELVTFDGASWTYGETWDYGGQLAVALADRGVEKGDRVALLTGNRPEHLVGELACVRGGFVTVPMNDMLTSGEYEYVLTDSGARAIVVGPEHTDVVEGIRASLPDLEVVVAVAEDPPGDQVPIVGMLEGTATAEPTPSVTKDDPLRLSYTGGTTGRPKGAYGTHGSIGAMMLALALETEVRPYEEMLISTPLAHAAGYYHLAAMTRGAHCTLTQGFDPGVFLGMVEDHHITWTFMVPTMLYRVLDHGALPEADLSTLDTIVYGAAPSSPSRLASALDAFGQVFIQLYGQTETAALATSLAKSDHDCNVGKRDTVGQPAVMTDVRIVDPEDETATDPRPRGVEGEVLVRAPYTFDHYHGRPDETEATMLNGWVRTGDIGRLDEDGYLHLLDRKGDVIITGGMNVYSSEVEAVLEGHPRVEQVAVVGIPHDYWGAAVHAVVVPTDVELSTADIEAFADEHLSAYKKPKSVEFCHELPKTAHGKIDKKALREER